MWELRARAHRKMTYIQGLGPLLESTIHMLFNNTLSILNADAILQHLGVPFFALENYCLL